MKSKLFNVKNSLATKMEKLNEEELSYVTGGATAATSVESAAGSTGTGSGPDCISTSVHCCFADIVLDCH